MYIDDVFIYLKSELHYRRHLKHVLQKSRQNKLYINAEKNESSLRELELLGHMLSSDDIRPDWHLSGHPRVESAADTKGGEIIFSLDQLLPKIH